MAIIALVLTLFVQITSISEAQELDKSFFKGYDAAFVLLDRSTGSISEIDPETSNRRLTPSSTFVIYETLIGLKAGVIKDPDVPWYRWDNVHRDIDEWNKNLTLREAFRASSVPAFQGLAQQIGFDRMAQFIEQIGYGNRDMSSGLIAFWLPRPGRTSILISAREQVYLLNQLLDGRLPFSQNEIATLKDVMKSDQTANGTIYGKTGMGFDAEGKSDLGWYVGFLESKGTTYVFACNIIGGENPSGKVTKELVHNFFIARGLL